MKKKYVVKGSYIQSKYDNEWHYISAERIINLYGVDPRECIIVKNEDDWRGINKEEVVILTPDYNGRYTIEDY